MMCMLLGRAFRTMVESKGKLVTIEVNDRPLEAIKRHNCPINYRFGNIPELVHRESPRKGSSEDRLGVKPIEVPEEIPEAIGAERT